MSTASHGPLIIYIGFVRVIVHCVAPVVNEATGEVKGRACTMGRCLLCGTMETEDYSVVFGEALVDCYKCGAP